jgi:hypothetical protein
MNHVRETLAMEFAGKHADAVPRNERAFNRGVTEFEI